jgi:hypothetical protein
MADALGRVIVGLCAIVLIVWLASRDLEGRYIDSMPRWVVPPHMRSAAKAQHRILVQFCSALLIIGIVLSIIGSFRH